MSNWAASFMSQARCQRVFNKVKKAGEDGLCILDLEDEECLTAGFLTGQGIFKLIGGGDEEPYIIRTTVDQLGKVKQENLDGF